MTDATLSQLDRFTTEAVVPSRRGDHWNRLVNAAFLPLETELLQDNEFTGQIELLRSGRTGIALVRAGSQIVRRSRKAIRAGDGSSYIFVCQTAGRGAIWQDQEEIKLAEGDITFVDSDRPYELRFDTFFEQAVFQVPKEVFHERCRWLAGAAPIRLNGQDALTKIIAQNMKTLLSVGQNLPEGLRPQVFGSLTSLVSTALGARFDSTANDITQPRIEHLQRAKRFILDNLKDEALNPQMVSAGCNISPRYLRDLFAKDGQSLTAWIKAQRLDAARMDMESNLGGSETLSQIAYRWGFADYTHFCRSFKAAYGTSPRAWVKQRGFSNSGGGQAH